MGRVWRLRNVSFVALLAVAALMLLSARGANVTEASEFAPTGAVALASPAAGAVSDVTATINFGAVPSPTRNIPDSFSSFTPAGWVMPAAGTPAIPIGDRTGTAFTVATLGLLNSACAIFIPISFTGAAQPPIPLPPVASSVATTGILDASTDNSVGNTIAPGAGFTALIADTNTNGIMDGAEKWHDLLETLLPRAAVPPPRERQAAVTDLFGTAIFVDILNYDPGILAPAALGFTSLTVIQNFSPALPATPSAITTSCGLNVSITQQGVATVSGATHRTNPAPNAATGGTEIFFGLGTSDRDADLDPTLFGGLFPGDFTTGFVNNDDTCPFTPNVGSPFNPSSSGNGDTGEVVDVPPAGPGPEDFPAGDAIDAACDPNPLLFDGPDADGDGYLNRDDNCPLVANGLADASNQTDVLELLAGPPVDGGPATDDIGDSCDVNPTVADGHFHTVLVLSPICVTAGGAFGGDPDGDGYCSASEGVLGSDAGDSASTPEALSIPTTCSDGADNDGDGSADLADTGCQLTVHDIAVKKVKQVGKKVVTSGGTATYKVILQNKLPLVSDPESVEVGILIDAIPGAGCSGPTVSNVTGGTVTGNGPLSIDGDTDIESLTTVSMSVSTAANNDLFFDVTYPAGCPTTAGPVDYAIVVDACHADDVAPLGLFGAKACGGTADGGQDRAVLANDAPVTVLVDANP